MSHLIREVDAYFCAGYNADFFEKRRFLPPYGWLKPRDTAFYEQRARDLINAFADCFGRVRPFVPIGPSMSQIPIGWLQQKYRNADHKVRLSLGAAPSWQFKYQDFEFRYQSLLAYRAAPLLYDVVLWDTLWGWPRHRYALHQRLGSLAGRYAIHARLDWSEPSIHDGSAGELLDRTPFPLTTGHINDYERMLASSRLAIFATGFHWGWRNIMMVALLFGLPVWTDRLLLEPWFDMSMFEIRWNDTEDWHGLEEHLNAITEDDWQRIRVHNQRAYDKVMAPEKVAQYFIATAIGREEDRPRMRGCTLKSCRGIDQASWRTTATVAL